MVTIRIAVWLWAFHSVFFQMANFFASSYVIVKMVTAVNQSTLNKIFSKQCLKAYQYVLSFQQEFRATRLMNVQIAT